jgi:hypothetical protein
MPSHCGTVVGVQNTTIKDQAKAIILASLERLLNNATPYSVVGIEIFIHDGVVSRIKTKSEVKIELENKEE